ncbi:hypothetical protein M8C21_003661 [Ambrosia artemisiifolia]|uniref:Mechanosensitive ion channel protein 2, chloroplastic n=1 Tax=Ambrosia artemisiifolia TaxID=4212 RepID=A0AAD5CH27_AMBAR|nr:hypothetical protein M8C21_003661 [Ambrosia artemisiifolia]
MTGSLNFSPKLRIYTNQLYNQQFENVACARRGLLESNRLHILPASLSSVASRQDALSITLSVRLNKPFSTAPNRFNLLKCTCSLNPVQDFVTSVVKNVALALSSGFKGRPIILKLLPAVGIVVFAVWGLGPLIRRTRSVFLHMGFQFAGKAVYTAVWVAAVSLFMELLGFSTRKWLPAGGLGTVLLTLAGREIFTNFLSSVMIHATRPFVPNEWIKAKIGGYEVSGTVEHVGWWSPTVIRGEDREAIHIPNHKFTMNVVRNMTQKTHWRIKTHLAISHLDVNKINIIVADMRKVLAKNPQVEQQRLHRRVFLENVDPENQSLLILVSCFVKTSHFEEYLCVKEAIMLDLLRVISHHRARLATPIRTVQKFNNDPDLDSYPFADSVFTRGRAPSNQPMLLIEPTYKVDGEEKSKGQNNKSSIKSKQKDKPTSDVKTVDNKTTSDPKDKKPPNPETSRRDENMDDGKPPNKAVESDGVSEQKASRAAMEENIVLGVALDGSKRTLPIDEGMDTATAQVKEPTKTVKGSPSSEKDNKDRNTLSSTTTDRK